MTWKAFGIVLEDFDRGLSPTEKLILATVAGAADPEGRGVLPPRRELAVVAICSVGRVKKALAAFEAAGVLAIRRPSTGGGKRQYFRLDLNRAIELYATSAAAPKSGDPAMPTSGAGEHGEGPSRPLACDHWRSCELTLRAELGEDAWASWLRGAIPERDDGEVLTLAVATATIRDVIQEKYLGELERITGRRVELVVRSWAGVASSERERLAAGG